VSGRRTRSKAARSRLESEFPMLRRQHLITVGPRCTAEAGWSIRAGLFVFVATDRFTARPVT
jgi:hypothetical protein